MALNSSPKMAYICLPVDYYCPLRLVGFSRGDCDSGQSRTVWAVAELIAVCLGQQQGPLYTAGVGGGGC